MIREVCVCGGGGGGNQRHTSTRMLEAVTIVPVCVMDGNISSGRHLLI